MNYIFGGFLIWQSICWLFFCCLTPGMAWLCFKLSTELQVWWTSQNFASIAHIGAEIPPILCYQVFTLASVLEKLLSGKVAAYKSRPITYRLSLIQILTQMTVYSLFSQTRECLLSWMEVQQLQMLKDWNHLGLLISFLYISSFLIWICDSVWGNHFLDYWTCNCML